MKHLGAATYYDAPSIITSLSHTIQTCASPALPIASRVMASPRAFRSPRREKASMPYLPASSSPDLPPLQDVMSQRYRKSPLKSGSKAAPIPDKEPTGFQSASRLYRASLLRDAPNPTRTATPSQTEAIEDAESSVMIIERPFQAPSHETGRKIAYKDEETKQSETPGVTYAKSQRRLPATLSAQSADAPHHWADAAIPAEVVDSVIPKEANPKSSKQKGQKTDTVSKHFCRPQPISPKAKAKAKAKSMKAPVEEYVELQLEQAIARRMEWTPPRTSTTRALLPGSASSTIRQAGSSPHGKEGENFGKLLDYFKCNEGVESKEMPEVIALSEEDSSLLKKRKLIETVDLRQQGGAVSASSVAASPTKKNMSKKKARTITEVATRPYRIASDTEDSLPPPTALQLFIERDSGEQPAPDNNGRRKVGGRKQRQPKKKPEPRRPVLLSPTAASKQFAEQDILFGTSSQLAREKSPGFLRDLQTALRASNETGSMPFSTPTLSNTADSSEPKSKLWDAAARDEDGRLFDAEVVDLVNGSPTALEPADDSNPFGYLHGKAHDHTDNLATKLWSSLDHLPDLTSGTEQQQQHQKSHALDEGDSDFSDSNLSASTNILTRKKTTLVTHPQITAPVGGGADQTARLDTQEALLQPGFETYSDAQLSEELRQYGFKPVKRRNAMISLLEQCWQSKHSQVSRSTGTMAAFSTLSVHQNRRPSPEATRALESSAGVKQTRGRPRKKSVAEDQTQEPPPSAQVPDSPGRSGARAGKTSTTSAKAKSAATATRKAAVATSKTTRRPRGLVAAPRQEALAKQVIEIPDSASDADGFSTPPRSTSPEQTFSSPEAVDMSLSMADTDLSLTMSPDEAEKALFVCITRAVKSAPRTTDPNNPSWHEKMLMYDPIIIEDLTAWLNSGQLGQVGYDGEVKPGDVKKWCESRSVCCLWRVNLRGKERKRY